LEYVIFQMTWRSLRHFIYLLISYQ
jgi:hypothetical protein